MRWRDLAFDIATRPGFDSLHDPNPATALIEPYYDPIGLPTQGYGRLLSREKWADLSRWPAVTVEQAKADLEADLDKAARGVRRLCPVPLTEAQFAALVDFTFNAGAGNLQVSALRQKVLRGAFDEVPEQLMRWVWAGGVKLRGLVRRRQAEAALWAAAAS